MLKNIFLKSGKVIFLWVILYLSLLYKPIYANDNIKDKITHYIENINEINAIKKISQALEKYPKNNENIIYFQDKLKEKENILKQSQVQKIILWYSSGWKEIFAYYRWDITKPFFAIFSNIHWWYEYGTYFTAEYLKDRLEKSHKTQWFIIPTLNPDWLEIASKDFYQKSYYIEWRENSNKIDINRNFCTTDFFNNSYVKKWKNFYSWKKCNAEIETQIVDNVLKDFQFSEILSLHSEWWIFFIPDNSYYDERIISLAKKIKNILPDYYFEFPTYDKKKDNKERETLEINQNKTNKKYSWLMENYIYQKYDIPILLIELKEHWKVETRLFELLNNL